MRILATFVCALVAVFGASLHGDELRNIKVGQEIPDFSLPTLDGEKLNRDDTRGRVLAIVFLSAQQRSSERAAIAAYEVHKKLAPHGFEVVFATADTAHTAYFRQERDRTGIHRPLMLDFERNLYGDLGLIVLPTTIIADGQGRLAHVISSHKSDYRHVLTTFAEHTLGRIDDAEFEDRLKTERFVRDRPVDRIARRRAAANLLLEKGLIKDAENELLAALEIDGSDASAALDLAAIYVRTDRADEAGAIVDQVLEEHPGHRRGKLIKGVVLYHQDRFEDAERALVEALLLNPDPVQTHYYLGLIYERRGKIEKANEHFKEALKRMLANRPL